jgi:hypothetical protein
MSEWNPVTEAPKPLIEGVKCERFLVILHGVETWSELYYFFGDSGIFEAGWCDFDGNNKGKNVRCWMRVPSFEGVK